MKIEIKDEQSLSQALMSVSMLATDIKGGKHYNIEIKEHKQNRSLNANAYAWCLQDKISKVLNRRIDDIHNEMVLQYGVLEVVSVKKEAVESVTRLCDYYKILGESEINGTTFTHIKCGIGTHLYNTAEMAKFIEGVVAEAQELGIETKTPDEIAQLESLWRSEK